MPELVRFHEKHKGELAFLSVSVDDPAKVDERVKPFTEAQLLPFHVYVLDETNPDRLGEALGLEWDGAVPATFLYDARGRLVKTWTGQTTFEALDEAVRLIGH
jgi:peroxiredoxin